MKIIITAGGLSKRFLDEGFNKPKYKIIVNNKSLLT
jgi:molybdopterin-guanine dinucleotide biosynthesis protein A